MAAKPKDAAPAGAPTAPPVEFSPPPLPPGSARRVVAHFITSGASFERRIAVVERDHGSDLLDVRIEMAHGRSILLERTPKRPTPDTMMYPSWEEPPAAA
jgi:hypothetical protein